jgi:hypothetical protein
MRNKEIGRRIHSIRRVVRGLQEMASAAAVDHLGATPNSSSADRTIAGRSGHRPSSSRGKSNRVSLSLLRACRIALMETETAASLDEIYKRILRRGSFSFHDEQRASSTLLRVLYVMAHDGEVRLLKGSPGYSWERVPLPEDASARFSHHPSCDMQRGMPYQAQERPQPTQVG